MAVTEADKRIGKALVILRGDRTQQSVATEMKLRGWKWSQATVWSVEAGERPLRLTEAEDLAEVLDTTLYSFRSMTSEAAIIMLAKDCSDAYGAVVRASAAFIAAAESLAGALSWATEHGNEIPPGLWEGGGWLDPNCLVGAVKLASKDHQHLKHLSSYSGRRKMRARVNVEHPEAP